MALVLMPREAFSAEVRIRIQNALQSGLKGKLLYYYLALGEGYIARLHFCFYAQPPSAALVRKVESEIAALARTWDDRLRELFGKQFGAARAHEMLERWGLAFTPEYKAAFDVDRAAADAAHIESLLGGGGFEVELNGHSHDGAACGCERAEGLCGWRRADSFRAHADAAKLWPPRALRRRASVVAAARRQADPKRRSNRFWFKDRLERALDQMPGVSMLAEAIAAVRDNKAENDPLNTLTLTAGLRWREVALVRAYLSAAFPDETGARSTGAASRVPGASGIGAESSSICFAHALIRGCA